MRKLKALAAVLLLILLSGCNAQNAVSSENTASSALTTGFPDAVNECSFSAGYSDSTEPQKSEAPHKQEESESHRPVISEPPKQTAPSEPEAPAESSAVQEPADPLDENSKPTESTPPADKKPSVSESAGRPEVSTPAEPPIQTQSPEEGEPSETSEGSEPPTEEPQPEQSTPPTAEESAVPEFDIQVWIDYATGYAQSIGLNLSPDATACWDNPITAGSHSMYLERDIQSRLNRYKRDGMTDVWIWAEERLDGNYDLFIGYA